MEERGAARKLLECSFSDKLCVVREGQYEVIVVPTLLVGLFLLLLAVILWLFIRGQRFQPQRPRRGGDAQVASSRGLEAAGQRGDISVALEERTVEGFLAAVAPSLAELQLPRAQLSQALEQIYRGTWGSIFRTQMNPGDPAKSKSVVLKTLRAAAGLQDVQDFIGQIRFYQHLGRHRNLVWLEGCCAERLPLYMVLEDVAPGDLLSLLWTCRRDVMSVDGFLYDLTEKQIYHIGKQVLLALEFLQEKHIFHGDVAARNVLIQSDLTAKLCGLGLAYEIHTRRAVSPARHIPSKWLAPERLLLKPADIRGDIWSFGILLYEMVTLGAPPYPEVPPTSILQHLQRRRIMKKPSSCSHTMYNIMKRCWRWSPAGRPLPGELCVQLEAAAGTADDQRVLQVPELVVPELYAAVAGVRLDSLACTYSIL
ncbi:tyrosine-protein kinase STYK1 [Dipodomys spectabilis]|uniref:tyrosine-protein kinase STYK1 n=1 Tax=Dipodomys spectabilis TaxID=105255 RepID=UPI001C5494D1|nr:tyrosine-protein kinase STYK1 [Dipodomys spectabilis]